MIDRFPCAFQSPSRGADFTLLDHNVTPTTLLLGDSLTQVSSNLFVTSTDHKLRLYDRRNLSHDPVRNVFLSVLTVSHGEYQSTSSNPTL